MNSFFVICLKMSTLAKSGANSKGTSYSKINSGLAEIESSILKLENTGEDHSLSRHRPRRLVDRIFGREEQC